jgi:hypothetical protein
MAGRLVPYVLNILDRTFLPGEPNSDSGCDFTQVYIIERRPQPRRQSISFTSAGIEIILLFNNACAGREVHHPGWPQNQWRLCCAGPGGYGSSGAPEAPSRSSSICCKLTQYKTEPPGSCQTPLPNALFRTQQQKMICTVSNFEQTTTEKEGTFSPEPRV